MQEVQGPQRSPDASGSAAPSFSVATFNVHAGVDGWGRPFDVVAACRAVDADVLVLEETWTPSSGPGLAGEVARSLGYSVFEHALAGGRRAAPDPAADDRWMRSFDWRGESHAIFLDSERPFGERVTGSSRYRDAEPGCWGLAVLSRLPVRATETIDLGRLRRDRARRAALVARIEVAGDAVTVVGTHMSHITYGAPTQFVRLRRRIAARAPTGPVVVLGDMNLWGPPVAAFFPGWRRALRRRTWPAWRPHSQVDHVLVSEHLDVVHAEVLAPAGSDHLPVRVRLAVRRRGGG